MGKYLLPTDETLVTELECAVVWYPKADRYRRALWGAISVLTKYWMWEPDGEGGEYNAADSWDVAYEQTLESFGMLQQILDAANQIDQNTDELEALIRGLEFVANCCGDPDPSDGDFYTDAVDDGVGTVPQNIVDAGFVTDANDWTGFQDYKCMIAHVVVDDMVGKLNRFDSLIDAAGDVVGGIAAVTGIITAVFTGGLTVMTLGILASLGAAAALHKALTDGLNVAALAGELQTMRVDLVCEFMKGDGAQGSLDLMLAKAAETLSPLQMLAVSNLNSGPVAKALYSGRYDQDDMAQRLIDAGYTNPAAFDCSCEETALFTYGWETDGDPEGWHGADISIVVANGYAELNAGATGSTRTFEAESEANMQSRFGYDPGLQIERVEFDVYFHSVDAVDWDVSFSDAVNGNQGIYASTLNNGQNPNLAHNTWHTISIDMPDFIATNSGEPFRFLFARYQSAANGDRLRFGAVRVYGTAGLA